MSEETKKDKVTKGKSISRRDFLKNAGLIAGGIGAAAFLNSCAAKTVTSTATTTAAPTTVTSTATTTAVSTTTAAPTTVTSTATSTATITGTTKYTLKMVDYAAPGAYPYDECAWIAKQIPIATGGRVNIDYYPAGSLYTGEQIGDAIRQGGCDLAHDYTTWMNGLCPAINYINNCLLFESNSHLEAVFAPGSEVAPAIWAAMKTQNVLVLDGAWPVTPGIAPLFNYKQAINKIEDVKGMKIRVPATQGIIDFVNAIGAAAVSIPVADVPSALTSRMVDGLITDWPRAMGSFALNINDPYCCNEPFGSLGVDMFLANNTSFSRLPADLQQIITKVVHVDVRAQFDMVGLQLANIKGYMDGFAADTRTKTNRLATAEKARFLAAAKPVWQASLANTGALGQQLADYIEKIRPQFAGT
jgi:TRAP-type C4-dicarboxylate transport system substrate-binding protein